MLRRVSRARFVSGALVVTLLGVVACKKTEQPKPETFYQVHRAATSAPINFIHKTFKVGSYAKFEFEVPAHSINPKLQGTFKSFATGDPDQPANVDLLLLTPEQFADFTRATGEPTYAVTGTSGQTVDYALPATLDDAQKYVLVFRNPNEGSAPTVKADFTASF